MNQAWASLALVALLLAPGVWGQDAEAPFVTVLTDAEGDLDTGETAAAPPQEGYGSWNDLVSVEVQELKEGFTFRTTVAGAVEEAGPFDDREQWVEFTHNGVRFRVVNDFYPGFYLDGSAQISRYAYVEQWDEAQDEWLYLGGINYEEKATGKVFEDLVPRQLLRDADGAAPFVGRQLEDFVAVATQTQSLFTFDGQPTAVIYEYHDRAPDTGTSQTALDVVYGVAQTGHAFLNVDAPRRASNGEATTFIFEVTATNLGDFTDVFELTAIAAPDGWEVTFPQPEVRIDAGDDRVFPVLVSTPFKHVHGDEVTFVVKATSRADPQAIGRAELGVVYPEIPQPSGHHPQVWFHSRGACSSEETPLGPVTDLVDFCWPFTYMNAKKDDGNDDGADLRPSGSYSCTFCGDTANQHEYFWRIPVSPSLQMGLDFDTEATGTLDFGFRSPWPMLGGEASMNLWYFGGDRRSAEELLVWSDEVTLEAADKDEVIPLHAEVTASPEADYLAYRPYQGLTLEIHVLASEVRPPFMSSQNMDAVIVAGGTMTMPLVEYRDPVDDVFGASALLDLAPAGPQQAAVNPGESARFVAQLANLGSSETEVRLGVIGAADGVVLEAPASVRLAPGATREISLLVQAPEGAVDGDVVDVLLEAAAGQSDRAILRFLAEVDTDADHADAGAPAEAQESPAPFAALILAALAIALLRRR